MPALRNCRIGVIGLGYVGLPLAVEFGKHFHTVGFDIKPQRIAELKAGKDSTLETTRAELKAAYAAQVHEQGFGPQEPVASSSSRCRPRSTNTNGPTSCRWSRPAKRSASR